MNEGPAKLNELNELADLCLTLRIGWSILNWWILQWWFDPVETDRIWYVNRRDIGLIKNVRPIRQTRSLPEMCWTNAIWAAFGLCLRRNCAFLGGNPTLIEVSGLRHDLCLEVDLLSAPMPQSFQHMPWHEQAHINCWRLNYVSKFCTVGWCLPMTPWTRHHWCIWAWCHLSWRALCRSPNRVDKSWKNQQHCSTAALTLWVLAISQLSSLSWSSKLPSLFQVKLPKVSIHIPVFGSVCWLWSACGAIKAQVTICWCCVLFKSEKYPKVCLGPRPTGRQRALNSYPQESLGEYLLWNSDTANT